MRLRISPQAVDNNGNFHDNNWPKPDPITDWNWTTMDQQCNPTASLPVFQLRLDTKGMAGEEDKRPSNPGRRQTPFNR